MKITVHEFDATAPAEPGDTVVYFRLSLGEDNPPPKPKPKPVIVVETDPVRRKRQH